MNMQALLKQAQKMQKDVKKLEKELDQKEYESTIGGGAIKVVAQGNMEILSISVSDDLMKPENKDDLESMMVSVMNSVLTTIKNDRNEQLNKITGGVKMPGM